MIHSFCQVLYLFIHQFNLDFPKILCWSFLSPWNILYPILPLTLRDCVNNFSIYIIWHGRAISWQSSFLLNEITWIHIYLFTTKHLKMNRTHQECPLLKKKVAIVIVVVGSSLKYIDVTRPHKDLDPLTVELSLSQLICRYTFVLENVYMCSKNK